jgi:hypothetical protein
MFFDRAKRSAAILIAWGLLAGEETAGPSTALRSGRDDSIDLEVKILKPN